MRTFDSIKDECNKLGMELLTTEEEYIDTQHKLRFMCNKHGEFSTTISNVRGGHRCPECGKKRATNKLKLNVNDVRKFIESVGYTMLDKEYVNSNTPINIECHHHGVFSTRLSDLKRGARCPKCSLEIRAKGRRMPISKVSDIVKECGYKLLDSDYKNTSSKINVLCSKHGEFKTTIDNLRNGEGCPECGKERRNEINRLDYSTVKDIFYSHGKILLTEQNEYKNSHQKLAYICKNHIDKGVQYQSLANVIIGAGCKWCGKEKVSGENCYNWKGGISKLSKYLRECIAPWRARQFILANGKCAITGKTSNCEVHHMTSFSALLNKTLKDIELPIKDRVGEYSSDEISMITEKFIYNNDNFSNPIVLDHDIHKRFHEFCGGNKMPTSFEQLEQFKKMLRCEQNLTEKAG